MSEFSSSAANDYMDNKAWTGAGKVLTTTSASSITGTQPAPRELVRLAIPRRVYTQSHIDYVIEVVAALFQQRERIPGYTFEQQARFLRHFTARYRPNK